MVSEAKTKAKNKTEGTGFLDHRQSDLKILTPKQMLQRLPIFLAQVNAGNTSENLLNEIRQIVYSLYRAKKKLLKSIQQHNQINMIIKNEYYVHEFKKW